MTISSSGRGLPRGPHGLTPSEVARNQRERLIAAMTEATAERGYVATPVSEVIKRAGVSRKTFYVHFEDRRDCLTAAYETAAAATLDRVQSAAHSAEKDQDRLLAIITALTRGAIEHPAASRLQTVEIAAGGQSALLLQEQLLLSLGNTLRSALAPARNAPPVPLMKTIAGGLLRVIDQRAGEGQLSDPVQLSRELASWARCYHPAPAAFARPPAQAAAADGALLSGPAHIGGRAPGTLSLTPRRISESSPRGVSPSFTAHSQRERILDAVANLCAQNGYVALTIDDVVAVAGVSLNTFYEHFKDKEDALLVAHEVGHVRGTAILDQMLGRASSWDEGVRNGVAALLGFFSSEPAFARLAAIETPIAGPQGAARSQAQREIYIRLMLDGAPRTPRLPAIASEAIAASLHAALFALATHGALRNPARAHSYATYLVLAPYLGASKALGS